MSNPDKPKQHSLSRIIIALIIIIIILLLLLKGCVKCESQPQPGPEATAPEKKETPAEPAQEAKEGRIFVKAGGDMEFKVFTVSEKDNGEIEYTEVTKGRANMDEPAVKPGEYLVRVYPKDQSIPIGIAVVESEKTTTLAAEGFGTVEVGCPVFQAQYDILRDGKTVSTGKVGISKTTLAAGPYQIRMKIAGLDIKKNVTVKADEGSRVEITEVTLLRVKGLAFNRGFTVEDASGTEVSKGSVSVSELVLPADEYNVIFTVGGTRTVTPVKLKGGEKQDLELANHGLLTAKAPEFNKPFSVLDKDGKKVASGNTGVGEVILLNGNYTVVYKDQKKELKVAGKKYHLDFK